MLVFLLGWWMVARAMRRARQRRREVKALRKRAETSEEVARREHEARVSERENAGTVADPREDGGAHAAGTVEPTARER
jgi:ABC-type nickel/cobalt efflux system permease component RcnA